MRIVFVVLSTVLLIACQQTTKPIDRDDGIIVGSTAWYEKVEQTYPTSDGQGHGPDYGSQEWCDVVYFRMHGEHASEPVPCNAEWFEYVDSKLPAN